MSQRRSPRPPVRSPTAPHDDQFPIDIYQTGSGTSTNTNMNEVVAHLAAARLGDGRIVHPNDDVNRCQSSNDTIPTALQLSAAMAIEEALHPRAWSASTRPSSPRSRRSGRSSRPAGRTSRTRPRSGSARSSAATPASSRSRSGAPGPPRSSCSSVPLGGTAVGTGHQRPSRSTPSAPAPACRRLTGLTVRETPNHFHAQATLDAAIAAHGAIRTIALSLWKIASDVRLMGMGPRAGLGRAGPARDAAGLQHHARQGEPGHRREPDDGRRPGGRQRRDGRLRPDRQLPRTQRDAAGDRRRAARVDLAARRPAAPTSAPAASKA